MENENTDHFSAMSMMILTQRMNRMIIGDKVRQAISDWYYENGMIEPQWETKDPEWWTLYLKSLDEQQ
jgi:hypothetical protein